MFCAALVQTLSRVLTYPSSRIFNKRRTCYESTLRSCFEGFAGCGLGRVRTINVWSTPGEVGQSSLPDHLEGRGAGCQGREGWAAGPDRDFLRLTLSCRSTLMTTNIRCYYRVDEGRDKKGGRQDLF